MQQHLVCDRYATALYRLRNNDPQQNAFFEQEQEQVADADSERGEIGLHRFHIRRSRKLLKYEPARDRQVRQVATAVTEYNHNNNIVS